MRPYGSYLDGFSIILLQYHQQVSAHHPKPVVSGCPQPGDKTLYTRTRGEVIWTLKYQPPRYSWMCRHLHWSSSLNPVILGKNEPHGVIALRGGTLAIVLHPWGEGIGTEDSVIHQGAALAGTLYNQPPSDKAVQFRQLRTAAK